MQDVFPIPYGDADFEPIVAVQNATTSLHVIQIVDPEFSSVCPRTGLPDFGRIILRYIPRNCLVELKSWKLFLRSFYGVGALHEECTFRICSEFIGKIGPEWVSVVIDWGARGGLHTTTKLEWSEDEGYIASPDSFDEEVMKKHSEEWENR